MTVHNGDLIITEAGRTVSNTLVNGYVHLRADNVTLEDVIVRAPAITDSAKRRGIVAWYTKADGTPYTGLVVRNTLVEAPANVRSVYHTAGVQGRNITLEGVEVRGWVDGVHTHGVTTHDTYAHGDRVWVHDLAHYAVDPDQTDGSHEDGWHAEGGRMAVRITRCRLGGGSTGALLVKQTIGTFRSVEVRDNFLDMELAGGAVAQVDEAGRGVVPGLTFVDNEFGRTYPSAARLLVPLSTRNAASTVITGNRYTDGTPVNPASL